MHKKNINAHPYRIIYDVYTKINNKLPRKKLYLPQGVSPENQNLKLYEFDFGVFPQTCCLNSFDNIIVEVNLSKKFKKEKLLELGIKLHYCVYLSMTKKETVFSPVLIELTLNKFQCPQTNKC